MSDRLKKYLAVILATQLSLGQLAIAAPIAAADSSAQKPATAEDTDTPTDTTVVKVTSNPQEPYAPGSVEFEQITVSANATPEMLDNVASHIKEKLAEIDRNLSDDFQLEVVSLSRGDADSQIEVSTAQDTTTFEVTHSQGGSIDMNAEVTEATQSPDTVVLKVLRNATSDQDAELKKVKIPLDQKIANFLGTTKRNLYFTIITTLGCGAIAAGLEHHNIVQLIGSDEGISPSLALITGLGVGAFEGSVQLKIKWYSDWLSDKAFNPYKLSGEKNSGSTGMANTWLKRFAVCLGFVAIVHGLGAWTGTRGAFEASLSYWGSFLYDILKDSGVYITSTLPLMEYMKAVGPKKGFDSNRRQMAIMEMVNFAITQGANAAILMGRLPESANIPLPDFLQLGGLTQIGPGALVSVGMLVAGTVLWVKEVKLNTVWQSLKSKASSVKDGIVKGINACSSIFKS